VSVHLLTQVHEVLSGLCVVEHHHTARLLPALVREVR
jgi:hypothetical protein